MVIENAVYRVATENSQGEMGMLAALSLRARIGCIFSAMAVIVVIGGASMLWYTHQMDTMLVSMVKRNLSCTKLPRIWNLLWPTRRDC